MAEPFPTYLCGAAGTDLLPLQIIMYWIDCVALLHRSDSFVKDCRVTRWWRSTLFFYSHRAAAQQRIASFLVLHVLGSIAKKAETESAK